MNDSGTVGVVIFVVGVVIFVVVFVSHDNEDDDDKARQAVLLVELPNALLEMYPYPHSARRLRRPECTVIMVIVVVLILLRGAEEADVVPAMKSRVEEEPSPRREEQQLDVACCGRAVRALLVPATPPLTPWDAIRQSIASS